MSFKNAALNYVNEAQTRTANGMKARKVTGSKVLDFFGKAGSSRGIDLTGSFAGALTENTDLALRALQWTRDIRGGAGERQQFRNILKNLDSTQPALAAAVMSKIPEIGRWDDLFVFENPQNRKAAFEMIKTALFADNALCAKWMPRKGPVAVELTKFLELTPRNYRKLIVSLTNVVETQMCAKDWDNINFSHVPSVASARYQKAFGRQAKDAYAAYLNELTKPAAERDPKVKINAGAVYPYDIVKSVVKGNAQAANAQWEALPNFIGDSKILPMVDVSGSMGSLSHGWGGYSSRTGPSPIEVAVSLGLYVSEKNTGPLKDLFLTFSARPEMITVTGTLEQRIRQMARSNWGMNTNFNAAFDSILDIAKSSKLSQEDMPEMLLVLSDMQFDSSDRHFDENAQQMIARKYSEAGYEMPKIVFWNLNGAYNNTPVRFDDRGVCHVSGFSPAIMKSILSNDLEEFTPYNVMLETLMKERYDIT